MKAQILNEETGPSGLSLGDVPDPVPNDDQVLVDVKSCGVCFPDLLMSQGKYQLRVPLPFTPGTEVAGVVAQAPAGSGYSVGDRVQVMSVVGGFAEKVVAAPEQLLRIPPELSFDEGAAMGINLQTAIFALKTRANLQPGETVGVLGSAGGVGVATIQVAKAMGAKVIAIVHRKGAEELLRIVGADEIVQLEEGWGTKIKELTGAGSMSSSTRSVARCSTRLCVRWRRPAGSSSSASRPEESPASSSIVCCSATSRWSAQRGANTSGRTRRCRRSCTKT